MEFLENLSAWVVSAVNQLLNDLVQRRIPLQVLLRIVRMLGFHFEDFFGGETENESVLFARFLKNLDVRAVKRSHCERTVDHKLHV